MLRLVHEHRRFFLTAVLLGLALRLFFFVYFPAVTDDSRIYVELATNWLQHGVYGQTQGADSAQAIMPVDTRLPGYPAFLAAIFWLFGVGNFRAVLLVQILVDIVTCVIIADLARRTISARAARIAFAVAALCPFMANYAAAELTETLEIFFTALALDCAIAALDRTHTGVARTTAVWAAAGLAIGACILLRPDGGILLVAVATYLAVAAAHSFRHDADRVAAARSFLFAGVTVALCAFAPLAPWTMRNLRTLHQFQPLAPRYANDNNELVLRGFNRWVKTWIADYTSVEEIYWNVPGSAIDAEKLPARALDTPAENNSTLSAIAKYNETQDITPELDARFAAIAAERIRARPFGYYVTLPLMRIADMWLRPRTELLPADPRWWEFNDDPKESAVAVGFGLLNLGYIACALLTLFRRPSLIRSVGLFAAFLLLRSLFLGTLENPEPRYTLECYPVVIVLASASLGSWLSSRETRNLA